MLTSRPLASVSMDVDDLWTYLRTHGDPAWERHPSYLRTFVPRALDLLDELGLRITFFLVGYDAALEEYHPLLHSITRRGHEVGNHTFAHECWLHLYTPAQLEGEVARAEEAIHRATGQRPAGFRGPGFSWSPALFDVLERRGYRYDASTLPTFLGPLARRYFLATAELSDDERERRRALFGSFRDGLRSVRPYRWQLGGGRTLLEIPLTTIPVVKLPFHMSYLLYLSRFSKPLMTAYLRTALAACRLMRVEPSFLLHPLDVLGADEAPALAFFPGMELSVSHKLDACREALRTLGEHYELVPMGVHANAILARNELRLREPALAT